MPRLDPGNRHAGSETDDRGGRRVGAMVQGARDQLVPQGVKLGFALRSLREGLLEESPRLSP